MLKLETSGAPFSDNSLSLFGEKSIYKYNYPPFPVIIRRLTLTKKLFPQPISVVVIPTVIL